MPSNFYNDVIQQSPYFNNPARINDSMLLEPVTRQAVYNILRDAYQQGNPLILFETYRSRERQALLFAEGKSQLRDVGAHHYGLAADLVRAVDGMPSWEGDYTFLAELAQKYGERIELGRHRRRSRALCRRDARAARNHPRSRAAVRGRVVPR
jgi:hypothetical protein